MNQIQNFNEGPAHVIDKPSGTVADENREDDASYLTNSEAHPFSEPYVSLPSLSKNLNRLLTFRDT